MVQVKAMCYTSVYSQPGVKSDLYYVTAYPHCDKPSLSDTVSTCREYKPTALNGMVKPCPQISHPDLAGYRFTVKPLALCPKGGQTISAVIRQPFLFFCGGRPLNGLFFPFTYIALFPPFFPFTGKFFSTFSVVGWRCGSVAVPLVLFALRFRSACLYSTFSVFISAWVKFFLKALFYVLNDFLGVCHSFIPLRL